jgi:Transcriptional regulators
MDTRLDLSADRLQYDRKAKPLYVQIEELLREAIRRGSFKKGESLPPIVELAKVFKVNRITVRRAIQNIVAEGMVESRRGKGTKVKQDCHYPKMTVKTKLTTHMSFTDGSIIKLLKSEKCPPAECTLVEDSEKAASYQRLLRVHSKQSRPYGYVELFLDSAVYDTDPEMLEKKLALRGVIAMVGKERIGKIGQTMVIGRASKDAAKHLKIPVGDPVAVIRRVVKDTSGIAIYIGNIVYPAELLEMEMAMDKD